MADLTRAIAPESWRRRRTVAMTIDDVLGPFDDAAREPYAPRAVDTELENALGGERTMVVVTGERLAGSTRSLCQAMRLMLGDRRLLPVADPHHVDLVDLLTRTRTIVDRDGPVVVVADDAPPALLDQIAATTTGLLSADVRLLLPTRQTSLDAFLAPETRALLDDATITVPPVAAGEVGERVPAEAVGGPLGAAIRPVEIARRLLDAGSDDPMRRAILRAVIDWERLAVPTLLSSDIVAELLPHYGVENIDRDRVRREIRRCLRHDVDGLRPLRRTWRGRDEQLVVDPVLSYALDADPTLSCPPPDTVAAVLRTWLRPAEHGCVVRVAFARDLDVIGLVLVGELEPDRFTPELAVRIARAWVAWGRPPRSDDRARTWFTWAIEHGDDDVVRGAHRELGLLEHRLDDPDAAYAHLVEVADDDQYVQSVLAEIAMSQAWPEADYWLAATAAGPDEPLASMAAAGAATRAMDADRLDDAERYLVQASTASNVDVRANALYLLAAVARRRGALTTAAERFRAVVELGRPEDVVQYAAFALAELRREAHDVDGEAEALRAAILSPNPTSFRAQVELAEIEIGRERWQDVLDVLPPHNRALAGHDDVDLRERRDAAMGEAAFQLGQWSTVQRYLRSLQRRTDRIGDLARVRLGQCAIKLGDVLAGYRLLQPMQRSSEADLAELARSLAKPLEAEAHRLAAQEAAVARAKAAARAEAAIVFA